MSMINKDTLQQKTKDLATNILQAVKDQNEEGVTEAFAQYTQFISQQNTEDTALVMQQMDNQVLSSRGAKQLTSEEKEFCKQLMDATTSTNPRQAISDIKKAMPETVIDTVLEDIKSQHPLLDVIDFQNTKGQIKMILNSDSVDLATWDELNTKISTELQGAIDTLDMTFCKLSAFLPVPMDMIDLGPSWLLTLIIAILSEALSRGLEKAAIDGDGKNKPIGMTRDLKGAVVDGVYPKKTPVVLSEITPTTYNAIVSELSKKPEGGYRKVPEVIFVCNPVDYLTKVLPATTVRTVEGTYKTDIFPYPTKVIQTAELLEGEAVIGIASKYFMGVGSNKNGKIEYDDSTQFLADNRVYKIKLLGNGRPKDNNAFILLDISNLKPTDLQVIIANSTSAPVNTKEVTGE